ncbi:Hpt domain-containing protein [Pseudooceanicola nanhaiensis]|uniref:Hpt domain-containing protein n=1 Tax=Pseudooceanicola nanhaiensis TaxID=375761 RepID=UPI001CD1D2D9|nr:Hpt domain-containing protein [Pseudooceanicola nanhaiensis]MCA0920294.1 Hpt domain-containing protein [Pseudooceanicola nanhaiensis]
MGLDAFQEVVDLFFIEVEEALEALMHGPGLEAQLHFLKGAALNLGFTEFAALCQSGETMAAAGRPREVRLHLIRAAYGTARDHFLAEWEWRLAA